MPRIEVDREIKLISTANTQIKFYNKRPPEDIVRKIERLLNALDITIKDRQVSRAKNALIHSHIYFDDGWELADQSCTLNIRSIEGRRGADVLIFKFDETKGQANGIGYLDRREMRTIIEPSTKDQFLQDGIAIKQIHRIFPEADFSYEKTTHLKAEGTVNIRRSWIEIAIDDRNYRIVIDKYYFFNFFYNKYSETFTEIEIVNRFPISEETITSNDFHPKILNFANILRSVFDVEVQPLSKYQRFKDFSIDQEFEDYYFIGFDVVAYSSEPSIQQKQIVQRFHKIIKDALIRSGFRRDREPIKISIGDGALIAVRGDWMNIRRLLNRTKAAVLSNNADDAARKIVYRTAIHYGSVFSFTDLNDMMNLAGKGINTVSRILNETNVGQTVMSADTYKRIIDSSPVAPHEFRELGTRPIKHGDTIDLVEYLQE